MKGCFLIAFVSVLMFAHGDVNGWKNAVGSGLWSGADNWWEGHVPMAGETLYVTNATPDGLTVTLDEDFVSTATNVLVVGNSGGGTNVVRVAKRFEVARASGTSAYWDMQIKAGGRLELVDGGELVRHSGNYGAYDSTDVKNHYLLGLSGGGEFRQTGGILAITNQSMQGILIGDTSGSVTSRYVMTGGYFLWKPEVLSSASLVIRSLGIMDVSGNACIDFRHDNGTNRADEFALRGGVFDLHGNATFTNGASSFFVFGMGTTKIRENASFVRPPAGSLPRAGSLVVSPNNADSTSGATAHVIVKDDAVFTPCGGDNFFMIGQRAGTRAVVDYSSSQNNVLGGSFLYVGCNAGYGELNLDFGSSGYLETGLYSGIHVGADSLNSGRYSADMARESVTTAAPTGVVKMASGHLFVGGNTTQAWNYKYLVGLVVGNGSRTRSELADPFESRLYRGEFHLSGGVVTNQAHLVVGAGRATGLMVQTGGEVYDKCQQGCAMVVGVAGGHGEYVLSNGTITVKSSLHVGGATTNQLDRGWANGQGFPSADNYPGHRHDAKGRFTIACADKSKPCKLAVDETITVSSDGAGLFEIVGSGADISAKDMIVSNVVEAVDGGESVVKFVMDEGGVSPVKLSGKLTIAEGAKLSVDTRNLGKSLTRVKLFSFDSKTGDFAPENVSITGIEGSIIVNDKDITFCRNSGFVVIVR